MNVDGLSRHAVSAVALSTDLDDVIIVSRKDKLHMGNVSGHCVNLSVSVSCVRNLDNGTTKTSTFQTSTLKKVTFTVFFYYVII